MENKIKQKGWTKTMRWMKKAGIFAMAVTACAMMPFASFASENEKDTVRKELAEYRDVMKENQENLQMILKENHESITEIKSEQMEKKEAAKDSEEIRTQLADYSKQIQEQRKTIAEKREEVIALRASSKEHAKEGDTESAKAELEKIAEIQKEQIELQNGLSDLLQKKLDYLKGIS